jgi:hypothetical protein
MLDALENPLSLGRRFALFPLLVSFLGLTALALPLRSGDPPPSQEKAGPSGIDVSGTYWDAWVSQQLILFQTGSSITGTWGRPGQTYYGTIEGTLSGLQLSGTLKLASKSEYRLSMTFAANGKSFTGRLEGWQHNWTGSRQPGLVVDITPGTLQIVKPGDQIAFTARVAGDLDKTVTWSASAGTIDENGAYTVPEGYLSSIQTVTATANADPNSNKSVEVTITPNRILDVSGIYLENWLSQKLVLFQAGNSVTGVLGVAGHYYHGTIEGTLSGQVLTGTLKFGAQQTPHRLSLTYDPVERSLEGRIEDLHDNWTAAWQPELALEVAPSTVQFGKPGDRIAFSARVAGDLDKTVTWSATAGTIDESGFYTVPEGCLGTVQTVTATANADPVQAASEEP